MRFTFTPDLEEMKRVAGSFGVTEELKKRCRDGTESAEDRQKLRDLRLYWSTRQLPKIPTGVRESSDLDR